MPNIKTLTKEDVIEIHERLVADAAESDDPISPPGIKNEGLLESAIARQHAGFGGELKYDDPISNAASLCYGICSNHPLHNGNKRTALVALLCHLDKNGFTFNNRTNQDILYSFMLNVASHKIAPKKKIKKGHDHSDAEVEAMAGWIRKKTRKIEKGERSVSYLELEQILREHDVYFENQKNNYVDVVKYTVEKRRKGLFGKEEVRVGKKVANIPYWPGRTVGKNLVKSIRKQAGLTHSDGIDSALFYGKETPPDDFIQKYKKVLSKLAKT
ncbi:type II toxin-antitoxin system death-on-curing family toxin [Microbulbifer thermotolerans]|uniref:Type II toxin-antitoxin system death-on-curing family toxin n=1 Tax=Microbulbifer thermotolerans TaxID=252514 RepID=A0AB35I089_MICTH|nr:type II toxin-antitoxin system death-on-curing family toxin [Microbulbifer thermotolerans]MCX2802462.1 type II toxin-antitoxin system death-on-curing family toxin [Microbulbifer thermotolerans]MCX2832386.1 type II toxin-antitoxin system death-on-curing family toxin [Microbulbifer thermotolerans]